MFLKYLNPKNFFFFLKDILGNRWLIWQMTKKDLKNRYLGSFLGIIWAFIQPAVTIFVLWFVFQVGFKSQPIDDFPFALWLMTGIIPWFFFSEGLLGATNSIMEYNYLIKKVVFRASILPIVKILSSLVIHLFFVIVLIILLIVYGYSPTIYWLQILYYIFATFAFILGLSFITSSLMVFIRDTGQVISVFIQIGFWFTPIFWSINLIPEKYQIFLKLNPVYYITRGFRLSLIYNKWFWEHPVTTIYFWGFTLLLWIIGTIMFKKLRPHFADVL